MLTRDSTELTDPRGVCCVLGRRGVCGRSGCLGGCQIAGASSSNAAIRRSGWRASTPSW